MADHVPPPPSEHYRTAYVPVPPDPARDARVAARRAADARRAGRALDRWVAETYEGRRYGAAVEREGRRLVADYLDALGRYATSELHHNRHYGVPCALGRGVAPVDGCPCVNCSLARPDQCANGMDDGWGHLGGPNCTVPVVGYERVTGVPLCEHGDDADACQLAHRVHRCADCSFTTASAERMDGHLRAAGHLREAASR